MEIGKVLLLAAVTGIMSGAALGCGGSQPAATDPTTQGATSGAKASCSGPDHTDKGHCAAAGQKASCSGPDHTDKGHCSAVSGPSKS